MKGLIGLTALLSICAVLAGCEEGRKRPPSASLTVVNSAPSFPDIHFYRGQRREASLSYLGGTRFSFDADQYNYKLTILKPGAATDETVDTFTHTLTVDTHSVYVIIETAGALDELIFDQPAFSAGSASTEFSIVHASEITGAIDVYVEAPGTDLLTVTPRATLAFRDGQAPISASAGDYVVTVTEAGNAGNVIYTSPSLTFAAGQTLALVFATAASSSTASLVMTIAGASAGAVPDVNAGSGMRVFNGAGDRAPRDVYLNGDFSAPFVPAAPFATVSDFVATASGETAIAITPAGNPSAIEREVMQTLVGGSDYTLIIDGDSSGLGAIVTLDDRRPTATEARLQFINSVNFYNALNFYLAPPGTDTTLVFPTTQLGSPGFSSRTPFPIGDFELTVRDATSSTIVFGPQTISMPTGGIYTIALVDNVDGTTADVVLLDDFQ